LWAIKVINYEEKQDFSEVDNNYSLDREAYRLLQSRIGSETIKILKKAIRRWLAKSHRQWDNRERGDRLPPVGYANDSKASSTLSLNMGN
jgi:hypothetical protein